MSLRLILLRHAKSSWSSGAQNDHQRPLNNRGRRAAPAVARRLVQLDWLPQVVLASDSQRTRETWQAMAPIMPPVVRVVFLRDLYLATPDVMQQQLRSLDDQLDTVLLLGHNPGCEQLLSRMTGTEHPMKTADAALLSTSVPSWRAATISDRPTWSLEHFVRAREAEETDSA